MAKELSQLSKNVDDVVPYYNVFNTIHYDSLSKNNSNLQYLLGLNLSSMGNYLVKANLGITFLWKC